MTHAQSCTTVGAGHLHSTFEMYDSQDGSVEVYVQHGQPQSLADSAAEMEEHADKQLVSQIGCYLLHLRYFFWFLHFISF